MLSAVQGDVMCPTTYSWYYWQNGATFTEPSWYSKECNQYQKLTTGINDQSFVLSLQLALTSLCYMQLVSKPYSQL